MQTETEWTPHNWIKLFCELGGRVLPHARVIQWNEAVTDFETMPTNAKTLKAMAKAMIEIDAQPGRRDQVFAYLGA